jgi:ATP-binding cassette subfamily F protein 3
VGVNGAGKSTLIKLLSGVETITGGDLRLGHNVDADHFAQDQYKALDASARLIDDIASVAPTAVSDQTRLRTLLGCFLFSADDVYKRIGVLSGGERNRYALARMLLQPRNFLLLDEPTNHLDMRAKDMLLDALQRFSGTVVFVSHDRYFIDKLATRVFEIGGGELRDYPGNYEDYLWQKERGTTAVAPEEPATARSTPAMGQSNGASEKHPLPEKPPAARINRTQVRKLERRRERLEGQIAECERAIAALELELGEFKNAQESARVAKSLEERRLQVQTLTNEWEEVARELEQAPPAQPTEPHQEHGRSDN